MKAIVCTKFGPPEVLQLQEVEKPTTKPIEVLIMIVATAVVKEDPDMRRSPSFNGFLKPRHPILGMELAGEVESVGKKVTRFKPVTRFLSPSSPSIVTAMPNTNACPKSGCWRKNQPGDQSEVY